MKKFFLRMGADYLEEARAFRSRAAAVDHYRDIAQELAGFGQEIEGSIHIAPDRDTLAEYPDCVLSLGPRGGVRVERA